MSNQTKMVVPADHQQEETIKKDAFAYVRYAKSYYEDEGLYFDCNSNLDY